MSTRSVDRSAVTHEKDRSAVTRVKDRSRLCSFTFANGHRCRTPRSATHPHLCYSHARKQAHTQAAEELGHDISYFFSGRYLSACDLSSALGRLFAAVAQGHIKPRTASTLAYLGQTLVQTIQLSQHEYINAFSTNDWRDTVNSSVNDNSDYLAGDSDHDQGQDDNRGEDQSEDPGESQNENQGKDHDEPQDSAPKIGTSSEENLPPRRLQ